MLEGPVLVQYRLTREDVDDLTRVTFRAQRWILLAYAALIVAMVLAALAQGLDPVAAVALGAAVAGLVVLTLMGTARRRRSAVGTVVTVEFSPQGVSYDTGRRSGRVPWRGMQVRREGAVLVLAHAGRAVLGVPARALSASDLARVEAWAAQAGQGDGGGAHADGTAEDAVHEDPDGHITVTGPLTPERARDIARGTLRRSVWRALGLAAAAVVAGSWAAVIPRLRAHQGPPRDLVVLTAFVAVTVVLVLVVRQVMVRRLTEDLGGGPMECRFSPDGVTTVSTVGESFAAWSLVGDAVLQGDMLVVSHRGSSASYGYLLGPLSREQRRRVIEWVEAGSGRRVVGAR